MPEGGYARAADMRVRSRRLSGCRRTPVHPFREARLRGALFCAGTAVRHFLALTTTWNSGYRWPS